MPAILITDGCETGIAAKKVHISRLAVPTADFYHRPSVRLLGMTPSEASRVHIVTKARGGEQFLEEWLRFHLALGVGKVWLYEDGDSAAMGRIARSFGERVLHIPQPAQEGKGGNAALLDTLRDWPTRCAASRDCPSWIFYTDPDEFLNLRGYSSILNFLDQFDRFRVGAVCLPRYDFGTSGLRTAVDGSVLQSFVHRMPVPVAPKCISSTALLRALTTHTQHAWRTQRAHRHARTPPSAHSHECT